MGSSFLGILGCILKGSRVSYRGNFRVGYISRMKEVQYGLNDKVYVFQGPMLYDARICRTFDPITQKVHYYDEKRREDMYVSPDKKFPTEMLTEKCYMVHYSGWNVKWDEWVLTDRIKEVNNENTMLKETIQNEIREQERHQRELEKEKEKERLNAKNKGKSKSNGKTNGVNGKGKTKEGSKIKENGKKQSLTLTLHKPNDNKKRSIESNGGGAPMVSNGSKRAKSEDNADENGNISLVELINKNKVKRNSSEQTHYEAKNRFTSHEIKTLVPDSLKIILVDDWENITKNNKIASILEDKTTNLNVSIVLEDFKKYLQSEFNDVNELPILIELTESIKLYFDQCIGCFLLYRYERPQFNELISKVDSNIELTKIYQPIFLLRLLSIMPSILMMNEVDQSVIRMSKIYLEIILTWLESKKDEYLKTEYENQAPWVSIMHG